jgi:hypothetical protein
MRWRPSGRVTGVAKPADHDDPDQDQAEEEEEAIDGSLPSCFSTEQKEAHTLSSS